MSYFQHLAKIRSSNKELNFITDDHNTYNNMGDIEDHHIVNYFKNIASSPNHCMGNRLVVLSKMNLL